MRDFFFNITTPVEVIKWMIYILEVQSGKTKIIATHTI